MDAMELSVRALNDAAAKVKSVVDGANVEYKRMRDEHRSMSVELEATKGSLVVMTQERDAARQALALSETKFFNASTEQVAVVNRVTSERDKLREEFAKVSRDCDVIKADLEYMRANRDSLVAQRNAALTERNEFRDRLNEMSAIQEALGPTWCPPASAPDGTVFYQDVLGTWYARCPAISGGFIATNLYGMDFKAPPTNSRWKKLGYGAIQVEGSGT